MAKHEVAASMTDDELRTQLNVCLYDYKRLWNHPESIEYINNELWYRTIHSEYDRRGMITEWTQTVAEFKANQKRVT